MSETTAVVESNQRDINRLETDNKYLKDKSEEIPKIQAQLIESQRHVSSLKEEVAKFAKK